MQTIIEYKELKYILCICSVYKYLQSSAKTYIPPQPPALTLLDVKNRDINYRVYTTTNTVTGFLRGGGGTTFLSLRVFPQKKITQATEPYLT